MTEQQEEAEAQIALNERTERLVELSGLYLKARESVQPYLIRACGFLDTSTIAQALFVEEVLRLHYEEIGKYNRTDNNGDGNDAAPAKKENNA